MIQQLEDSIKWNCDTSYYDDELKQTPEKYSEYLSRIEIEKKEGIKSALESIEKQKNNAKIRNNWIKALKDSLK